ncbi:MAG: transcription-repair coupling factor [Verrucomicrobiota bacterium]
MNALNLTALPSGHSILNALAPLAKRLKPEGEWSLGSAPLSAWMPLVTMAQEERPSVMVMDSIRDAEEAYEVACAWGLAPVLLLDREEAESPQRDESCWLPLKQLLDAETPFLITTQTSWEQDWISPDALRRSYLNLQVGLKLEPEQLIEKMISAGYELEAQSVERGQIAKRGGIVDVFSVDAEQPVRLEWFGEEIESIRLYDPVSQSMTESKNEAQVFLPANKENDQSNLASYFKDAPVLFLQSGEDEHSVLTEVSEHDYLRRVSGDAIEGENRRQLVRDHLEDWMSEGWSVWLVCHNEGEEQRLREWLSDRESTELDNHLHFFHSSLRRGFIWPSARWVVMTDAEIFSRYQRPTRRRADDRLQKWRQAGKQGSQFDPGDYVVHLEYGVGLYRGLRVLPSGHESTQEALEIEYQDEAKLYVPLDQAYLVSRYVGVKRHKPSLDTLGHTRWSKKTAAARVAVKDYAAKLIKLQAERDSMKGYAFPPDHPWQSEFEASFIYQETDDQLKAIAETKADMEKPRPMDRLICGDVGFGKTEVAIRAVFKAVTAGKQVAFLAPTTVLAQQHYQTLTERMADYPIQIGLLSRFVSLKKQRETMKGLQAGTVDVVVGTHRLLSPSIEYKDLGLVVVDEEQRFGVEQKEKLKMLYHMVDMLTLSATPIPRTLYFALMGARDMSTIDTPPANRRPVETQIAAFDERLIRQAVQHELHRGGQVFFLHNRVQTIERMAKRIRFLIPDAKVAVGHGQMPETQLEDVMAGFLEAKTDVLVSTTIIESGIDIPNANTIIIDRADRFGLADLYQLRGRVGRSTIHAHALLLVPRDLLGGDAGKRVRTIKQYSQLGSGFKVAMRDLEIRGAGNLLGHEQSGHIATIGFELYCRLLKKAISALQGKRDLTFKEVKCHFDFIQIGEKAELGQTPAYLPASYMQETSWRIEAYRHLAELESNQQWNDLKKDWRDRFGPLPDSVNLLLEYQKVRIAGLTGNITQIDVKDNKLMIQRNGDYVMIGKKFPRLNENSPDRKLKEIMKWIESLS